MAPVAYGINDGSSNPYVVILLVVLGVRYECGVCVEIKVRTYVNVYYTCTSMRCVKKRRAHSYQ